LPSVDNSESFGIVLAESMSCGTPVIASNLVGVRSVFADQTSGFVVTPRDSEELVSKINFVLDHPEEMRKMRREARQLALDRYAYDRVDTALSALFS